MTLIVGTRHWRGICLNADTRTTSLSQGLFLDNAQKIAHVKGGIGMACSGDSLSAIMVRDTLIKHLDRTILKGTQVESYEMPKFTKNIVLESLKDVINHPAVSERPIYDVYSTGLIGVNIPFLSLTINSKEANNLIKVIVNSKKLNRIYSDYIEQIVDCSSDHNSSLTINEFPLSLLYKYKIKLYDDTERNIIQVDSVEFGTIVAFGSGSNFDYSAVTPNILSSVLFSPEAEDISYATQHLVQTLFYADKELQDHPLLGFKTFGGSIIAGAIRNHNNGNSSTDIVLSDYFSKEDNKIIYSTFTKGGKLWVKTKEDKETELIPFPSYIEYLKINKPDFKYDFEYL